MELSFENLALVNQGLNRIDFKGKQYTLVASRIQAFRKLMPGGSITTEILSLDADRVVMRATIADDAGRVLATGTAFETQGSSFINKTSFIENAETSAVGRALGMLGIGSEEQMCSAEELVNAISQRDTKAEASIRAQIMGIINRFPERELARKICERYKVGTVVELSAEDAARCLKDLKRTVKDYEAA